MGLGCLIIAITALPFLPFEPPDTPAAAWALSGTGDGCARWGRHQHGDDRIGTDSGHGGPFDRISSLDRRTQEVPNERRRPRPCDPLRQHGRYGPVGSGWAGSARRGRVRGREPRPVLVDDPFSIIATETAPSRLSIPGFATRGISPGSRSTLGFVVGRFVVDFLLGPILKGTILTFVPVLQPVRMSTKQTASVLFILTAAETACAFLSRSCSRDDRHLIPWASRRWDTTCLHLSAAARGAVNVDSVSPLPGRGLRTRRDPRPHAGDGSAVEHGTPRQFRSAVHPRLERPFGSGRIGGRSFIALGPMGGPDLVQRNSRPGLRRQPPYG